MSKLKITAIISSLVVIIAVSVCIFMWNDICEALGDTVVFKGGEASATINGEKVVLDGEILSINECLYVPSDKPLTALGFKLGWKDDIKSVVAIKNNVTSYIVTNSAALWKGPDKYTSKNKTIIHNGVFYIPMDMFTHLTDATVKTEGEIKEIGFGKRDLLEDTVIGDNHRLPGTFTPYNGVYVNGNFAMERVSIPDDSALYYSAIINKFGEVLPDNVNIFNIVVPSSSEFYGNTNVYTNQTTGIKKIYENLSQRIIPVNAIKPLYAHANEGIYFRTDHHWTQRGAYYAYEALMNVKGEVIPPLSDFPVKTGKYTGSFAGFAKGTAGEKIIKANPDTIEIFAIPKFTAGASYNDMYMKSYNRSVAAVYQSTDSYYAYLGGDNPLTVLTSSAGNGKKAVVMKESFGNAFAPWLLNNYSEVYVVDIRKFNTAGQPFKIREFYDFIRFDDLIIINYPVSVASSGIRTHLLNFI